MGGLFDHDAPLTGSRCLHHHEVIHHKALANVRDHVLIKAKALPK